MRITARWPKGIKKATKMTAAFRHIGLDSQNPVISDGYFRDAMGCRIGRGSDTTMRRIDARAAQVVDLPQPVDLAFSNGLGVLLREQRRRAARNGGRR